MKELDPVMRKKFSFSLLINILVSIFAVFNGIYVLEIAETQKDVNVAFYVFMGIVLVWFINNVWFVITAARYVKEHEPHENKK